MSWTDERVETLKKLWGEGRTAAEIASALGGVTRNAVIGKAHRLKLSGRASPIQQSNKKKAAANSNAARSATRSKKQDKNDGKANVNNPAVKKVIEKSIVSPITADQISESDKNRKRTPLVDLGPCQCRWPLGDPRDSKFGFCAEKTEAGEIYCAEHARVAYQTVSRSRTISAEDLEREEKARAEKMALGNDNYS